MKRNLYASLERISLQFSANLESVTGLLNFDSFIVDIVLQQLTALRERLERNGLDSPKYNLEGTLKLIGDIKKHDSTKINYQIINNQCIVLLVSFYTSAIEEIFKECLLFQTSENVELSEDLFDQEIKMTLRDFLNSREESVETLVTGLIERRGISFQDMQSTSKAFETYVGIEFDQSELQNTVIFIQASRHAITHALSETSEKFLKQIRKAVPRRLKESLEGVRILEFTQEEIETAASTLKEFIETVRGKLESHCELEC